jgi:anaerobic glycerol-3-phosphate dehydrogenase
MNKNLLYLGLAALGLYLLTKQSAQAASLTASGLCAAGFTPIQGANGSTYCIANANTTAESVVVPYGSPTA